MLVTTAGSLHSQLILNHARDLVLAFKRIVSKLPPDTYLPYDTNDRSILLYYKHVHPLVYSTKDSFHCVVALPIIQI